MEGTAIAAPSTLPRQEVESAVVRFAGDSGDGMQLTGGQFTLATALAGNDLATFPDFPAEIRAPAGTLAGVSGFQIHFSSEDIHTPADQPDLLVAFNPAALRANTEMPGSWPHARRGSAAPTSKRCVAELRYVPWEGPWSP